MQCDLSNKKCKPREHVAFNRCTVRYRTHSINELSENDFICSAKIDAL